MNCILLCVETCSKLLNSNRLAPDVKLSKNRLAAPTLCLPYTISLVTLFLSLQNRKKNKKPFDFAVMDVSFLRPRLLITILVTSLSTLT